MSRVTGVRVFRMFQKYVNAPTEQEAQAAAHEIEATLGLGPRRKDGPPINAAGMQKLAEYLSAKGLMTSAALASALAKTYARKDAGLRPAKEQD